MSVPAQVRQAKISASASCAVARALMQNCPFSIILAAEGEVLLTQSNIIGGSSVIEATEVPLIPASPAGPLVVTI